MEELLNSRILTLVTFAPAAGALALLLLKGTSVRAIRAVALAVTILTFVLSLHLIAHFDSNDSGFQYVTDVSWIPSLGIRYHMGVDGISVFLILLATSLTPLAILASWPVTHRVKEYFLFMLLLETGMIGVFAALDLFLFYLFWEVMLIPMYFLIGVWGGERRIYAATKFCTATRPETSPSATRRWFRRWPRAHSASPLRWSSGCSWRSSPRLPLRSRSSRFIPGCRTRTLKRRPQARCCWPACC
jgi:hypothetical protein